jgi:ATP-dependent exoDNAse (exonuclease V) beta subunit
MLKTKVEKLFAPPDPLADETLQMMTIHKAKGLEFETVILPGLHRQTAGNDSRLLVWDEVADAHGHEHLLVAPMRAKGAKDSGVTACDYLKKLEAKRTAHESVRLLYVAATRAIRHLHLVGVVALAPDKPEGLKTPVNGSLLNLLWTPVAQSVFAEALPEASAGEDPSEPTSRVFIPKLWRLRQPEIPEILRSTPLNEAFLNETNGPDNLPDITVSREACVGTLVHRYLELMAKQGLAHWPLERLAPMRTACERWLSQQGLTLEVATEAAGDVLAALQTTLNSEAGRWVLSSHTEAAAEQAWSSRVGNVAVNHVIDRVFIADGCRWIIDYKTVQAGGESFKDLRQQAEKYRPQLERYAGLFVADKVPTRMAVFFPVQGELVELTE